MQERFGSVWTQTSGVPHCWPANWYQVIRPISFIVRSISRSSLSFASRLLRIARVSRPWMVLASEQRCRPSGVFGPVEAPPWVLHAFLPCIAAFRHCTPLRFDFAWQRGTSFDCLNRLMVGALWCIFQSNAELAPFSAGPLLRFPEGSTFANPYVNSSKS